MFFKSAITNKYVRRIEEYQPLNGYLSSDGANCKNQIVEFRLEQACTGSGMYHIKYVGSNKYLQVKSAENANTSWITADADARNKDQDLLACTLFDIDCFGTGPTTIIQLRHRYLKRYACLYKVNDTYPYCLCALSENTSNDSKDVFVYSESK
ncbi:uncharacterized protein LOC114312278 [Camellia sinensis]|uniref:uncharacterized protein LOC114312278 n=1 Tax=Camellia sinensis TaxID=4442 RepID=UPI0010361936|nr:uncharacterized protein LOC114312278 [Camellia sinensis]